ncbi:MAG: CBS domain-containing protein [Chloroflexi bacterium]|nr:CBS domain-containing protein [Chloroflexota bacterium]
MRNKTLKVKDVGIKEVHCANPSMTPSEITSMMKKHHVGVIPVCEGKKLLGVLADRDLVINCMAVGVLLSLDTRCQNSLAEGEEWLK